jgi:hypothetical protein
MILAACFLGVALLALVLLLYKLQRLVHEERRSWQLERANLIQRIAAPELAAVDHSNAGQTLDMPHVPVDDDEAYWDWQKKAEELMQTELGRLNGS